ncbi:ribosomal protein S2 [Polychaeton citri CBS 116435]|uniref:Ribosomal protein S2 n=1 Tax=Polychaeton citri CBS 116435 TaxID=1314669 RepID=A0A9P4QD33_9PEZI|nr:ribosomal protein S2 [Polychaeton citri CBS 116435]
MILRSLRLRHSRIALPRPAAPFHIRPARRFYAQDFHQGYDADNVELISDHFSSVDIPAVGERTENPFANEQSASIPASQHSTANALANAQKSNHLSTKAILRDPNHEVAQDWAFEQAQRAVTGHVGADIGAHYQPHELLATPPRPSEISLELLMASQSHLGHATSLWNPANSRYIFGIRDGIHIISLDVTAAHLRRACKVVDGVTARGGLVLFVGTREGQVGAVVRAAKMAGGCHLFDRWTPGSITNGQQILGRCRKLVLNYKDEPVDGFEFQLESTAVIKPDLVVCLNPLENYVLLHECALNNIPTIGVIDTDANPTWVTYPIPANDDSLRCIEVIAGVLGRAGEEGQAERKAKARRGVVEYPILHRLSPPSEEDLARVKEAREAQEKRRALIKRNKAGQEAIKNKSPARDPRLTRLRAQQREVEKRLGLSKYDPRKDPEEEERNRLQGTVGAESENVVV